MIIGNEAPRPALWGLAFLLGLLTGTEATAQGVRVGLVGQPILYTCEDPIPLPASAPPGIDAHLTQKIQRECGGGTASGKIIVVDIFQRGGGIPAGRSAIQTVTVNGARFAMNPATGKCDRRLPYSLVLTEYFDAPAGQAARDHHATAECCESRAQEKVSVRTILAPLPAGARPPIPGFGAGYPYTTPAQRAAIEGQIRRNARVLWGYQYDYDGCNTPRMTPSGKTHHLRYRLRHVGGPFGAITITSDR